MYRILACETFHSCSHPSSKVREVGHAILSQVLLSILRKSSENRRAEASDDACGDEDRKNLLRIAEENEQLATSLDREIKAASFQWQWGMTWIVAQKAKFVDEKDDWMSAGNIARFTEPSDA